ncbi:MAG TPA: hypothetical protein VMS98_09480 [Thermoanaerobaculia bacterium]|nr:hypothetical protein [Thermoanaerobaculia bacterium]
MSDSRRLSPFLLMFLLLAGCKSFVAPPTAAPELGTLVPSSVRGVCDSSNGDPNKDNAFICIDDLSSPMQVRIKDLRVHDRVGPDKKNPVMIRWIARSGFKDLDIKFPANSPCVDQKDVYCYEGRGFCRAFTKEVPSETRCEYEALIEGVPIDPVIIVEPCCAYEENFTPAPQ